MTQILRQSTQIKVVIGPVVAVGDGFTPVTTLSLASADEAEIIKSDSGTVTDISAATFAAITSADGYYNLTLTTSHTDTVGLMTVLINDDSLCLPVKATFQVIEEAVYDALYAASALGYVANAPVNVAQISGDSTAADNLEAILDGTGGVTLVASAFTLTTPITANATQISGDATAADNAESFFDGTGYAGTNNVIPTVTTATNVTTVNGLAAGVITATSIAADAITAAKIATGAIDADALATDAVNEIADGILGRDASASTTNSTLGAIINDWENGGRLDLIVDDILVDTAAIDAIASKLSGLVMASEVIGSTGNSTTAIHMPTLTYGNDEINDHLLVIYDNSTGEFHSRWVTAWSNASKLATVATLPFTPENAVDTYYLTSIRRDMTAATVSDKTGYSISGTTTTFDALQTALNSAHGAGSWATATGFSTHSAADVWAAGTRTLTAATNISGPIADQVWEEAIADHSGTAGSTAEALNAAGAAGDPWTTALPGAYGAGSAGYIIGTNINATISSRSSHTAANVRTEMDSNSTQLAAIVADTNELQTDWANGGRLDLLLDATLADTNELQTDWVNGGRLDLLLDATLADTNELQTDWANGGRLDLIVDAILVDTAEIGAAGAGLTEAGGTGDQFTAIPWNAAWDTEVQSECTDALNAYDPPTKAETDALLTTAMTEAYPTDGSTMTVAQALYLILANVSEFAISGTTLTVKKIDGSTTAATYTLDDATNPTSRTRAS